jgi:hypothetical protein
VGMWAAFCPSLRRSAGSFQQDSSTHEEGAIRDGGETGQAVPMDGKTGTLVGMPGLEALQMNSSDASSKKAMRTTPLHMADTRLHGRWLVLAWAAWALLSSGTLLAFAFGLPVYLTHLQTVCIGTGCLPGQPAPDTAATLHGLSLSAGSLHDERLARLAPAQGLAGAPCRSDVHLARDHREHLSP